MFFRYEIECTKYETILHEKSDNKIALQQQCLEHCFPRMDENIFRV